MRSISPPAAGLGVWGGGDIGGVDTDDRSEGFVRLDSDMPGGEKTSSTCIGRISGVYDWGRERIGVRVLLVWSAMDSFAIKGEDSRDERSSEGEDTGEEMRCAGASVFADVEVSSLTLGKIILRNIRQSTSTGYLQ